MAEENNSSTATTSEEVGAEQITDASTSVQESPGKNWFSSVLDRFAGVDIQEASEDENQEQENKQDAEPKTEATATETTPKSEFYKVYPTQEEHERDIQREVDRRAAHARKAERQAERKRLRDEEPLEFARKDAEWEAEDNADAELEQKSAEVGTMLSLLVRDYDSHVMDPLVSSIPEDLQAEILKKAPPQLEGRKFIVTEVVKAIQTQARKEAEENLRTNDAFRKELLRELQDSSDEPELAPAAGKTKVARNQNERMNDLMLQMLGR